MTYVDETLKDFVKPEEEVTESVSNIDSNIKSNINEKQEFQLTVPEKYNSLFNEENLEILFNIVNERKINVNNETVVLPEHYRTLKNDITISMKTNSEIYSKFQKVCCYKWNNCRKSNELYYGYVSKEC